MTGNKYVVLGCGPAGLMAVHGIINAYGGYNPAMMAGVQIVVLSRGQMSHLFGAQYLHKPIPPFTSTPPVTVEYLLRGSPDEYRSKVYGPMWDGTVSPEDLSEAHQAWDIRQTYEELWARYRRLVMPTEVTPATLGNLVNGDVEWKMIINTIPRDILCTKGHTFRFTEVVAAGDAPSLGINISKSFGIRIPSNTVICNGEDNPTWYRASNIFGHVTVEWPGAMGSVPVTTAARVKKPLDHNCDCWPTVKHVGRYGSWTKGVLSHQAYDEAKKAVSEGMIKA